MTNPDCPTLLTAPLGGSPLSRAIQDGSVPSEWQTGAPENLAAWRTQIERVRAQSVDWLAPLSVAFGPNTHSVGRRRLAEASRDGVVVTTGQQPGLFGGPAYTLTKALSALALADELSAQLRVPVAPVFWAATDDADWPEAAVTHVVGEAGLERLVDPGPATEGIAMSDVPLGDVSALRSALRRAAGSVADPLPLDIVDATYTVGTTVGSAYVAWLRAMLEPLGIAVLDAAHSAVRTAADPLLRSALRHAAITDRALSAREAAIREQAHVPQVEAVDGLSLVFETTDGVRTRVPIADADARAEQATVASLGANVLLRPVLERALMPTVAYVAGPGELAYFAQATAVATSLEWAVPVAVPRWSMTWREPRTDRILERLGATADELREPQLLEGRLARASMDRDVSDSLDRLRGTVEAQVAALRSAVSTDADLVPATVIDGLARDLNHRLDRAERRLVASVKRRQTEVARGIAVARAALHPMGSSPERVLSLVPTLARFGPSVLLDMRALAAAHAHALVVGSVASS